MSNQSLSISTLNCAWLTFGIQAKMLC